MKPTPQQEIANLQRYIEIHHGLDADLSRMPERTMNSLFNRVSPEARAILKQNQQFVTNFKESGGREAPFEPKRSMADLDLPGHVRAAMNRADSEDTAYRLNERLGTPTTDSTDNSAPDLRETISASFGDDDNGN